MGFGVGRRYDWEVAAERSFNGYVEMISGDLRESSDSTFWHAYENILKGKNLKKR